MDESDIFKEELRTWRSVTTLLGSASPLASARSSRSASSSPSSSGSLAAQASYSAVPAMVIDVILDTSEISGNQVLILNDPNGKRHKVDLSGSGRHTRRAGMGLPGADEGSPKKCNIVLERWTVSLKGPPPSIPPELPTVYKHCIIVRLWTRFTTPAGLISADPVTLWYITALSCPIHPHTGAARIRTSSPTEAAARPRRAQDRLPAERE